MLKSLTISSVVGLFLGLALLAWLRPTTSQGAVATVVFSTFLCVGVGGIAQMLRRHG